MGAEGRSKPFEGSYSGKPDLSHAKRVLHVSDRGPSSVTREDYPDYIETKCSSGGLGGFQVQASGAHDAGSLASIHRLKRMSAFLAGARTDLNEDQDASIICHQVQLPLGAAPVPFDDAIATRLQQIGSQSLSAGANRYAPGAPRAPVPATCY